ncbi:hypothetical protein FACHB389_00175 [Nostoc calcicola FACHB-389]|nr:hypothetical protein [Nostoc calcicola FACHB-3891]OKH42619.1 hypothetical protein FACHB389_00175 [Nostoc calcicola FACHB-389]
MASQTSQQAVIETQKLQQLQNEIQQELHEILKNAHFDKILKKYDISTQDVLQFQYTLNLTTLGASDADAEEELPKFVIPGKHMKLCGCTCWSKDINDFVDCPCH